MKKQSLIMLLVILMLLALGTGAYAESDNGDVTAAAAANSIEFVSITEVAWDHITYTVRVTVTDELAEAGYRIGTFYSPDQGFSSRSFQFKDTFGTDATADHLFHEDDTVYQFTRYTVQLIPDKQYYIQPMLVSSNVNDSEPIATGDTWSVPGPVGNSSYTEMLLNQPVVPTDFTGYEIHAKFTAAESGQYALVGNEDMEFVSYCFPDGNRFDSLCSVDVDHGDGTTSGTVLKLFLDLSAGETVYLFGKRAEDDGQLTVGNGELKIVPAADAAPTENSIEVGDPYDVSNLEAKFDFTVNTTAETAQYGYQVGIVFGDHGTNPASWQGIAKIYMPEYTIKSSTVMPIRNSSEFVPGMDVDYQAALFDFQTGAILARGSDVHRLQTLYSFDNMTQLTKDTPVSWSDRGKKFYFIAPADGMYAVQGTGMNRLRLTDRTNLDLGVGNLLGSYLKKDEVFFPVAYNNAGKDCTIEVKDGRSIYRSVQINDGSSQVLDETTPVWFQAPEAGLYRFAIDENSPVNLMMVNGNGNWQDMGKKFEVRLEKDQILWLRRTFGEVSNLALSVEQTAAYITSDLDLSNLRTYQITKNTTVEAGVNLTFFGTELQIDPGVTLTIRGNAEGTGIVTEGIVRIEGYNARMRTDSYFREVGVGSLEVDSYGEVELASNSIENNVYLDPNMNLNTAEAYGNQVTFGYYVPSEQYMRSLLETLDDSNPNIRLDLQIYSGITLSDDLELPEHVTLHTDYNWGQGQGFTIPAGKTLTLSETNGFYAFSSAIDIQGTLVNKGEIILGEVGNLEHPAIYTMTLAEGGAYSGHGVIIVETADQPESYLVVSDAYKRNELWRDPTAGGRTVYRLLAVQNLNTLTTLEEDWTIPEDVEVNADTLAVPAGITLTVQGRLNCRELIVNADAENDSFGLIRLDGYSGYVHVTQNMTLDGRVRIDYGGILNLTPFAWNDSVPEHVEFVNGNGRIEIQGTADSPEHFAELYEAMENMVIPEDNTWFYSRSLQVLFPWTPEDGFVIPREIDFSVRNDGAEEQGSLTVPAGSTFTVDQDAILTMSGADLTVNGTICNNGNIELMTVSGGPNGTMPRFTLGSEAEYAGTGWIEVRSFQADPLNYLVGFDPDKLIKSPGYEDNFIGVYRYVDKNALLEEFKAACESENPPGYYDKLRYLGSFTIPESLTIPAEMYVDAWGTTFVLSAAEGAENPVDPITLTIEGEVYCDGFEIPENTSVEIGDYVNVSGMTLDGTLLMGSNASFYVHLNDWEDADAALVSALTDPAHVSFTGENARISFVDVYLSDNNQLQTALDLMSDPAHYSMDLYANYPCVLSNDLCIPSGVQVTIESYGQDAQRSLTVTERAALTLQPESTLILNGAQFTVSGELVNNGALILNGRWTESAANLILEDGGSYSGGGTIQIRANDDLKSHIMGIDRPRVITVQEDLQNGSGEYRIVSGEVNVLSDGDILRLVTSEDIVFPDQYSANYIFTPDETGLYTFRFSFAGDPAPAVHEESNPMVAINGTSIERSFDTDWPESMVIRAELAYGEGYEFVLAHDAALGALNVDLSVSAVTGGLNNILNSLAGTGEAYNLREATVIGAGETVTVPEGVWLNLYVPLTVENGGSLINAGGILVEQGGILTVSEGGMLELRDNPETGGIAMIQLAGGSIDAAENTVTYGEDSTVYLPCWEYNDDFATGRAAAGGIPDELISVDLNIWTTETVFGLNGYPNLWENLAGYHFVTFNLYYGVGLQLTVNEIPEQYQLRAFNGSWVEIPENSTVDLNGCINLNGGTMNNQGVLNVNGSIYFMDIDSFIQNFGTINVFGRIETNYGEDQNGGTIQNYNTLTIKRNGVVDNHIRVVGNLMHYEDCLVLPAGTRSIEEEAFADISAQEVVLPESIESVGSRAFAEAYSLRQLVIQNGDAQIGSDAFEYCYNLRIVAPAGGTVEAFATNAGIPFLPME